MNETRIEQDHNVTTLNGTHSAERCTLCKRIDTILGSANRPLLMGFRIRHVDPGHTHVQLFAGRNEGARANSGTVIFGHDEWDEVKASLIKGGWEEMPPLVGAD